MRGHAKGLGLVKRLSFSPEEIENVPDVLQLEKHPNSVCYSDHQLFEHHGLKFGRHVDDQDPVRESILAEIVTFPL